MSRAARFALISVLCLFAALAAGSGSGLAGQDFPSHSDWMSKHKDKMRDLAVNQVTLLGSHDAASRDVSKGSPPATGYLTQHGKHLHRRASAKDVRSARCQSATIAAQLKSGVRYLDLRVARQDGDFFAIHMWLSTPFFGPGSVMAQIRDFLAAHPDEVLVLCLQHMYSDSGPMTGGEAADLIGRIDRELPGLLIPKNDVARLTYGEIWQGRGRVILISGEATELPSVWSAKALDSTWFNQDNPETLVSQLDGVVASWRAGASPAKLRHLQAMTTTGDKILAAQTTNELVRARLVVDWRDAPISVVQVDDSVHADMMQILLDRLRTPRQ